MLVRTPTERQHQEHIDDANGETKDHSERETPHQRPSIAFPFQRID